MTQELQYDLNTPKHVYYSYDEELKLRYASKVEESQPEETPTEE